MSQWGMREEETWLVYLASTTRAGFYAVTGATKNSRQELEDGVNEKTPRSKAGWLNIA